MVKIQLGNPLNTLMIPARIRNKKEKPMAMEQPKVVYFFNIVVPHIRGFRNDPCCT